MDARNCWNVKKCGHQIHGKKVRELGVCPAATDTKAHGKNNGINGGRYCWKVAGTFCDGVIQGQWAEKRLTCLGCEFFIKVKSEEGDSFVI